MPKKIKAVQLPHVTPWYIAPDRIRTNEDIIRAWVFNGYEFACTFKCHYVTALKPDGRKLFWNNTLIAEHFLDHVIIYPHAGKAQLYKITTPLRAVLTEAGYTLTQYNDDEAKAEEAQREQTDTERALAEIFG